ncbi:MAG: membrane integrity-associated transporter subunit PqiC [Alphaproteobacteria bacterium]|nr:membrane integrity-associated transporter subunit PqiC [Alphaproteobacteria bacterium]
MAMLLRPLLIVLVASLSGCAFSLTGGAPPPDLYDLSPKSTFNITLAPVTWQLVVDEPVAASSLDTDRIAIRPSPLEYRYYDKARWIDRAPALIQTLLVESFENSDKIVAVGRRAVGLSGDFVLKSELREFQAERFDAKGGVQVRVRITFKLVKVASGLIIASTSLERVENAQSDAPQDIVQAFDNALGYVLKRAVTWTLEQGQRSQDADS